MSNRKQRRTAGLEALGRTVPHGRGAHDSTDLAIGQRLRQQIEPFEFRGEWTREQAIDLLRLLSNVVGDAFDRPPPASTVDLNQVQPLEVWVRHPAAQCLEELSQALEEIATGKLDPRLRPERGSGRRAYATSERTKRLEYIAWVDLRAELLRKQGVRAYAKTACRDVARVLASEGRTFAGRRITPQLLRRWTKNSDL